MWDHRPPLVTQKVAPTAAGKSSTLSLLASVCKVELLPQVCLESMTVCVCVLHLQRRVTFGGSQLMPMCIT